MKKILFFAFLLFSVSVFAQNERVFTVKCNISQSGGGAGYWTVNATNVNDPLGLYDATEISEGDSLQFNDGGVQYSLGIDTVISKIGSQATFRVSNVGVTGISNVPTTSAIVSRGTPVYGFVPWAANISDANNQANSENTMRLIEVAIDGAYQNSSEVPLSAPIDFGGVEVDTVQEALEVISKAVILKENGLDTLIPYPAEFAYRPFDIFRNSDDYHINPDFDLQTYAGIQVAQTYYVNPATGSDAAAGTSWGTALKSINIALAKSDVDRVYLAKGIYYYENSWRNQNPNRDVEIIGDLTQGTGDSVWVTRQIDNKRTTAWANVGNYYWAKYNRNPDTLSVVFDSLNLDAYGDPTTLTEVGTTALVNSTANSYRVNLDTIFVHTFNNRAPDAAIWLMGKNGSINSINGIWNSSKTLYVKNVNFRGGGIYTGTSAYGSRIYLDSVDIWFGSCFFDGMTEVIVKDGDFRTTGLTPTSGGDALNYDPEGGVIPNVAEINVRAYNTTNSSCTNCQASTTHNGISAIRINGFYADTYGQNVADVGSGKTFMLGCTFRNARPASSAGYYAGGATGFSWLERCTFIAQQASNDDIYSETSHKVYSRHNTPDEGNGGSGTYAAYSPNETQGQKVSEMWETFSLMPGDGIYVAKKNGLEYVPSIISPDYLFLNSGAIIKNGSTEGALLQAQKFRLGVHVNGLTGAALSAKALSTTTPAFKFQGANGHTGNLGELYNASGGLAGRWRIDGRGNFGTDAATATSDFSWIYNSGNPVFDRGGRTTGQFILDRTYSGTNYWAWKFQGNFGSGRWDLDYNNSSLNQYDFSFVPGGTFNVATGFQVLGAATNRHVMVGDGTKGVFRALVAADLPAIIAPTNITGTTTNNDASAGSVGEYVSSLIASGSAVSLTTATPANVTSISLTAGDWDVEGWVNYNYGSATVTQSRAGINTTSATIPTDGSEAYSATQLTLTSSIETISLTRKRISIASTTTVYLVGQATFSAGTTSAFGGITARRVR